ncbi:hypothetical protein HPP92_013115 [Vanilla planifolia]|uniref:Omega-hydroxypalmitate O-feruloyl transferase n=1 Tax=Vanilla planifolia TaxID=51239 RepID=A0A835QWG3_VANPL|nr:hypothetical protein HPP92_013115 [Vanilla planifolia]
MGVLKNQETVQLLHDIQLSILSSSILFPAEPIPKRTMFLSDIDQLSFNFDVETVHFFAANARFPLPAVAQGLQSAIERVLVTYDFLAGRLRFNEQECRLEIDCNSAGVGFVLAESAVELADIKDLDYPHPAFRQLVTANAHPPEGKDPFLLSIQLTSFKCGGFVIGLTSNHITLDGISTAVFLDNIAAIATGGEIATMPFTDRRVLSARTPPRVSFSHPELLELPCVPFSLPLLELKYRLFRLTDSDIETLKRRAQPSSCRATSFKVVAAHIWRCKALATAGDKSSNFTLAYIMNIRARLRPPVPAEYAGNGVLFAIATATVEELTDWPFWRVVEAVAEGATRMDDEYVRSVMDWSRLHRGFPRGDFMMTTWMRLGFHEVEYPWGRPICSGLAGPPGVEMATLLPGARPAAKEMNLLITMRGGVLERFTKFFYELL